MLNRKISIAPMMEWTDRHDRYFLRLISPNALLYTEMVTVNALIHGDIKRHLAFHELEHPLALQLGGSDPTKLAHSARLGEDYGYDEINLNVGCPSDRVKSGSFGACLMLNPNVVADCIYAMNQAVKIPVTIKCRIGVDHQDSYAELQQFIQTIAATGCNTFIIHARKAWLNGLSPKENREIPPLQYETVYQIKRDFPHLTIVINGGIKTVEDIDEHLCFVDGVMIGREAYSNPYLLAAIEDRYFTKGARRSRHEVIEALFPYIEEQLQNNVKLSNITRHILGLFQGQKNARIWRRHLSENANQPGAGIDVILAALDKIKDPDVCTNS
jgi:tRNA-dihydrouridine synthase A